MFFSARQNALHKAQLYRLLTTIIDEPGIALNVYFKGGTCAAMLGYLNRFSVDLDFDLKKDANKNELRKKLLPIFKILDLKVKDQSKEALQFFLKYEALPGQRNTIKLELLDKYIEPNQYKPQYLKDIDRTMICQTIETMFANKLVAIIDRYEQNGTITGRDIYDTHYFFNKGYAFNHEIIEYRRKTDTLSYLRELRSFIDDKINQTVIDQGLNPLLDYKRLTQIRKTLKNEVLMFIQDVIENIVSQID
ncbi:MAG: nucleotidyl transferase AbiEii/AbiGii toxin family protein [Cytophagales bacterium]|nr:nucleotidyl transferase AbiEii/AbiGii toxin family protein [Cytophagales bacterium]